ncbi:MAG: energy transducer TonB [Brevinematales bacterium]|nr:energy transducer TonB [Brevinematales bacterium]
MKKEILFLYLSLLVHLYFFLGAGWWLDPEIIALLKSPRSSVTHEVMVENIFIDNPHPTHEEPQKKPKLSEHNSRSRGPVGPLEEYNMILPQSPQMVPSIPQKGEISTSRPGVSAEISGPSLYDPSKKPVVRMSSRGEITLESEAIDFAPYFKHIQQTVASNWQLYFPVFQYYKGVMGDGVVTVTFDLDNEGNLKNVRLTRDFGYDSLNHASLKAIQHTSNYGPLPEKLQSSGGITVEFHFIYIRP